MAITDEDGQRLREAHFLEYEIDQLATAVQPGTGNPQGYQNLDGPTWQAAIKSRIDWWDDKRRRGWSKEEIEQELLNYYQRDQKRTPWDFLKVAYHPPKKFDYLAVVRARHASQIEGSLEGYYEKRERKYKR